MYYRSYFPLIPSMACPTKVSVVTGANKGIGYEIVRLLCQHFNGDVLLTARNPELGQAAVGRLEEQGLHPVFHQLDITDQSSIASLLSHLTNKYGGLDILVNNAGIMFPKSSTVPFPEQVKETMKINFWANLDICKALFPILRPHARVVNVSSMLGNSALNKCSPELKSRFTSTAITMTELETLMQKFQDDVAADSFLDSWPQTAYGVSKIGLTTMTGIHQREMDVQGRTDIVVNACCPGWCRTDMGGDKAYNSAEQGADTPLYLATLAQDIASPRGQILSNRKLKKWTKTPSK